jgi:hypothetical protein
VLGTIAKNPLLLKKESDGKVSFTLATATIDIVGIKGDVVATEC